MVRALLKPLRNLSNCGAVNESMDLALSCLLSFDISNHDVCLGCRFWCFYGIYDTRYPLPCDSPCLQSTCARMYDILRENDPVAASLLAGLAAPAEQHRTLTILMSTIISRSAKPALLEETLRSLGERHIQRGVRWCAVAVLGALVALFCVRKRILNLHKYCMHV